MPKFSLVFLVVSVALTVDVVAMKGGQILKQPLPYTVYILTGDRDDVFYMRKKDPKYKIQEGVKTGDKLYAIEEYHAEDENNTTSPVGGRGSNTGVENTTSNSKGAGTSAADSVTTEKGKADIMGNKDGNISPDSNMGDAWEYYSASSYKDVKTSARKKVVSDAGQGKAGGAKNDKNTDGVLSPETAPSEKSNEKGGTGHDLVDDENGGKSHGKRVDPRVHAVGLDGSQGLPGDRTRSSKKIIISPPPSSQKVVQNQDTPTREGNVSDGIANKLSSGNNKSEESNAAKIEEKAVPNGNGPDPNKTIPKIIKERVLDSGEDGLAPGGDGHASNTTVLRDESPSPSIAEISSENEIPASVGDSSAASEESRNPTISYPKATLASSWMSSRSNDPSENFNNTKPPPPHCKLADVATVRPITTNTKSPRPKTLWRFCMGVIFDDHTILTGDICFARAEGLHFFASVNTTNHDEAQVVTKITDGRNHFDFRVIRLNENQTLPGEVPDWQDEDTVYWNIEEMSNSSRTGIVPSFGYLPMVAALKLLPLVTCQRIYDELLEAYPAQTSTLPAFLVDTVVCATQADKPIDFPDGIGLVKPGLACPDSLGAPFVLDG